MKKSSSAITLVVLAALGSVGCGGSKADEWGGPPRDPCDKQYFDKQRCEEAIRAKGYHYGGTWYPMHYVNAYPYYYGQYSSHVASGGIHRAAPSAIYSPSYKPSGGGFFSGFRSGGSSVSRGGFGSSFSGGGFGG